MKVSVLTLHSVRNYGTQLQAYATQELLKQHFDEVDFIDYRRYDTFGIGLLKSYAKGSAIRMLAALPTVLYWEIIFGGFQKKYLNIAKPYKLNEETVKKIRLDSDAYFVGSDQVWNAGWNGGVIPTMYLDFVPDNIPKYTFSSSFGRDKLSKDEVKETQEYIDRFKYITVREASGVDILKKQFNYKNVNQIIDPTMLIPTEFWRKKAGKRIIKEKYILIYNLNRSKEFDDYAEELAKRTGYKLYRFCTRFDQIIRNGKSLVIPPIFDFINYINNAEIVLTDSFHASALSIKMNTRPICIYPKEYSNRISEFLELVKAEGCHAKDFKDFSPITYEIDFKYADKVLEEESKKSDLYLKQIKKDLEKNDE